MLIDIEKIAKKYAIAFLNVFGKSLSDNDIGKMQTFDLFLQEHKKFLVYISIPSIREDEKYSCIKKLSHYFQLTEGLQKLLFLLIEHKRLQLADAIVKKIITLYYKIHKIALFKVSTSHPLEKSQQAAVQKFIGQWVPEQTVQAEFCVVPELISGIRIKSDTFLWERSINKQVQIIKKSFLQRVGS